MKLSLPAVEAFGPKAAMIDPILGSAADANHAAVLHGNVESAAIAAEQACRRDPGINVVDSQPIDQVQIHAYRPGFAR